MPVPRQEDQRPLSQLLADVTRESAELMRKEIELAKLEIAQNASGLKGGATSMVVGVPLLLAGFLIVLIAAVLALDEALQRPWLSALLVGITASVAGGIALLGGRIRVKQVEVMPQRSVESLREDKEMLQHHIGPSTH
jgi:hypothetical protein